MGDVIMCDRCEERKAIGRVAREGNRTLCQKCVSVTAFNSDIGY